MFVLFFIIHRPFVCKKLQFFYHRLSLNSKKYSLLY